MESAFGWIGKLFSILGSLVPRLLIVDATQLGVAFRRGRQVRVLRPGLYVYWPFWTRVDLRPAVRQTVNLPTQALCLSDAKTTIVVGGMVRFEIVEPRAAIAETFDLDTAVVDETMAVICEYLTAQELSLLLKDRRALNTAITHRTRSVLRPYGINVLRAQLTDLSPARTLCILGHLPNQPDQRNATRETEVT